MNAKSVATNLVKHGVLPLGFKESNDPQVEDGEVTITENLYVQVGVFEPYLILNRWQDDNTVAYLGEFKSIFSLANKIKKVTA
jgi:aconitase A